MRINSGDALRIKGETGERGEQGIQGHQGIQGVPGEQGIPGIPGPAGVVIIEYSADGNTWNDSYTAGDLYMRINSGDALRIKGETGERGEQGIQGHQGIQGVPGEQGIPGIPGPAGVVIIEYSADGNTWNDSYTAGDLYMRINSGDALRIKGETGEQGEPGQQGIQGEQGPAGVVDINTLIEIHEANDDDCLLIIRGEELCKIRKINFV
jgi:hypothetical protein